MEFISHFIQVAKKHKPLLIFKGAEVGKIQREIGVAAGDRADTATTSNGWMTGDLMFSWVKSNLRDMQHTLLIWDLFAAHRDDRVRSFLRNSGVDVIYIPGGCTGLCQVMDVAINRPFKTFIRNAYVRWRGAQIKANQPWESPNRSQVIDWVLNSWDNVEHSLLEGAMMKHVVNPATAAGPLPNNAPSNPEDVPSSSSHLPDSDLTVLDDLALPREELQNDSGTIQVEDQEENVSTSSSEDEDEGQAKGKGRMVECFVCQRPLREVNRMQCPSCQLWFHPGCVSVSSSGKCQFC